MPRRVGGQAGKQTTVELTGWNLPTNTLLVDNAGRSPGVYPVSVCSGVRVSNYVPFSVDALDEGADQETNDAPDRAQAVTLPSEERERFLSSTARERFKRLAEIAESFAHAWQNRYTIPLPDENWYQTY